MFFRRTQNNPELLDTTKEESLYRSQFNRAYPTKIVIHGFGGGRIYSPSTDMRDAYFYKGNYNVIIVDYSTLVEEPCLKVKTKCLRNGNSLDLWILFWTKIQWNFQSGTLFDIRRLVKNFPWNFFITVRELDLFHDKCISTKFIFVQLISVYYCTW